MKPLKQFSLCLFFGCFSFFCLAQTTVTTQPRASQKAKVSQTIGLMEVEVTYHRPAMKGRAIWGKLVPYGAPWRAGANENTIITFNDEVQIEGKTLAAGQYGLHVIPNESSCTIAFSKNHSAWGSYTYDAIQNALTVTVEPTTTQKKYEWLTFDFDQITAKLKAAKEEDKVQAMIIQTLENDLSTYPVTWKEWDAVAKYCHQQKQSKKALEMANQSVKMNPNMTNMMTKTNILTGLGQHDKASKIKKEAISKGSNGELNTYGYQLLLKGKTKEAVAIFEANAKKHPDDPNVWDSLGEGYMNNGQKEKAIEALKKAVSMNPPANVKANSLKNLSQLGVRTDQIKP